MSKEGIYSYIQVFFEEIAIFVTFLIGILEPGILSIFLYEFELFLKLDVTKLLILSLSITIMTLFINMISSMIWLSYSNKKKDLLIGLNDRKLMMVSALFLNSIIFHIPIVVKIYDKTRKTIFLVNCVLVMCLVFLFFTIFFTFIKNNTKN